VKLIIKKYCNAKTLTVVLLLLSFNLVSFGQDINNCLCKKQKVESKQSCCKKEAKKETSAKKCCAPKETQDSKSCNKDKVDNKSQKDEGTLNERKLPKLEAKTIIHESLSSTFNKPTNLNSYRSDNSPGIRSKVFLDISSLRI
jgi:hypothetical protein